MANGDDDIVREHLMKLREAADRDPELRARLEREGVSLDHPSLVPAAKTISEPAPPGDTAPVSDTAPDTPDWFRNLDLSDRFVPDSRPPRPRRSVPPAPAPAPYSHEAERVPIDPDGTLERLRAAESQVTSKAPYVAAGIGVLLLLAAAMNWLLLPWDKASLLEHGPKAVAHHMAIEALLDESGLGAGRRQIYHDPRAQDSDRLGSLAFDAIQEKYPITIISFEPSMFFDFPSNFIQVKGSATTPDGDRIFNAVFTFRGGPVVCVLRTDDRRSASGRCPNVGGKY